MEQRRSWLHRRFNLSGGDKQPQTQGRSEFIPAMRPPPSQPSTVFQPAVNQPPTLPSTAFQPPANQRPYKPSTVFQAASNVDTSVFQQVLTNATPSLNTDNDLDGFNGIAESIKSGPYIAGAVLNLLQQRLGSNNGSWIETFKSLQLLDYLLHLANAETFPWTKQKIDQIKGNMPIIQDEIGRQRVWNEFRVIEWLVQDNAHIVEEVRTQGVNGNNEAPPAWLARCHERPMPPRQVQRSLPTPISYTDARSPQQPRQPLPPIFRKRMERTQENFHATGFSFLNCEDYDELHNFFRLFVPKGAVTMPKQMAYNALRGGLSAKMDDSQVDMILSWCDIDQLGELFFPDFALAFYLLVVIPSQEEPLGVADTAELRTEVAHKVLQLTGGYTRRQFLARQKTQSSRVTEDAKNHYENRPTEYHFDETICPDDVITQVPAKRKGKKRRDRVSPPGIENPRTTKPTVEFEEGSDRNSRMIINQDSRSGTGTASTPSGSFNSSRSAVSDLVRDSKLETVISNNGAIVRHILYESNPRVRQRRLRKEQTWKRVRALGEGAFGCVWLEERLDREDSAGTLRAVKGISKIQPNERHVSVNYNRELEAIAKFSHSKYVHCFVQSFGWYESEHAIFIAMEYMVHGDLQGYLSRPFPEGETKQILYQLLEGLCFMHDNGFAHRDLKPANILVSEPSPHWWVKIGDFGISKRAEEEATALRTLVGTKGYFAPEVMGIHCTEDVMDDHLAGDDLSSTYTVAVDIWALGAIMFRLLNNRNAFDDLRQLARYITAKGPFPRDGLLRRDVSRPCMEFLELAMARSPKHRPTSHQALSHAWLRDLHDSTLPPEALLDRLSITSENSLEKKNSIRNEDTAPSADWPSTFD